MVRVKKGKAARKHRKHLLKHTKGFRWGRKAKFALAKDALLHGWKYSYRDRRAKKRTRRQNWNIQINSLSRELGLPYNKLIHGMKLKKIELDRKVLSELAEKNPEIFKKIVAEVQK